MRRCYAGFLGTCILLFAIAVRADDSSGALVQVSGPRDFNHHLELRYAAEPMYTLSWFRVVKTEVLRANGIERIDGPTNLAFPSVVNLLMSAGVPEQLQSEVKLLAEGLESLRSIPTGFWDSAPGSASRRDGIAHLALTIDRLRSARAGLVNKVEPNKLRKALIQMDRIERGFSSFMDPQSEFSRRAKDFAVAERSFVRALACLVAL